ncbi:glycosyltransferase, partial [Patescibacteria group bacterium]|nr:glycosyltransferase [Patescibacteria group bacterium]
MSGDKPSIAKKSHMAAKRPLVMLVMHELGAGGAERMVYELARYLPEEGFDTEVVTVLGGGELLPMFVESGIRVKVLERRGFFGIGTILELRRIFRAQQPSVVHTHLFLADTWGRIAAWLARVPAVISTEHNVNPSYGIGKRLVNRCLAPITDAFVAVSAEVKRILKKKDGVPAKKIKVIRNGIDMDAVLARGAGLFKDVPRLLCVGRLFPQKDYATLFKALALVKRPWRLSIAGTGPLERELRALAERLHIAARIEWLGYREDVPVLLSESDVLCFPSRYEGLGLAPIEAAAAGVPVVASDLLPLREVFAEDDITFVPTGDVPAWSAALNNVLGDPAEAVMRAVRAAPKIRAEFDVKMMVKKYARLYREMGVG